VLTLPIVSVSQALPKASLVAGDSAEFGTFARDSR
jgi:hypothetical protein